MSLFSDLELARTHRQGASDTALVRGLARALVADVGASPPVDPRIFASMRGIERIETADQAWAGCLFPDGDRFVIKVRGADSGRRQRFTICHEVAHTFMPGFALRPQFRCDTELAGQAKDPIEQLCDVAASELLMPFAFASQSVRDRGPTLSAAVEIADSCETSVEAAAGRVVDVSSTPTMLLHLEVMSAPRHPEAEPVLRVKYAYGQGPWPYVPRYKSISATNPIQRALEGEVVDDVTTLMDLCKDPRPVRVSAQIVPWRNPEGRVHQRVLVLVTTDS